MKNYYDILGIKSSASAAEIRRAYRILARRYHPDVNPEASSHDRFKLIAEAYRVLSDEGARMQFDAELQQEQRKEAARRMKGYGQAGATRGAEFTERRRYEETMRRVRAAQQRAQAEKEAASRAQHARPQHPPMLKRFDDWRRSLSAFLQKPIELPFLKRPQTSESGSVSRHTKRVTQISIIEVSLTVQEAIQGVKKTVEVSDDNGRRKVSVQIPPGTRTGSVVRLRNRAASDEEIVLIARVAVHPYLSLENKGLIVETPITIFEAIAGASISVPTLEDEVVIKIPPGSQSGTDIRVRGKGILLKPNERGDLFYRLQIRVPESSEAVGLKDKAKEISLYYESPVRSGFPKNLLQM